MKKMKRFFALMFSFLMLVSVLSGCGNNNKQNNSVAKSSSNSKTELTLWAYYTGAGATALKNLINEFNSSQDKVEVTFQFIPDSDLKKQLSIGAAANKLPDIVAIDNPDLAAFASMGILADISDKMSNWPDKNQYFEGPLKSTIYNGKNYGLPFVSNCLALYYNVDMLNAAGIKPPQTWDDLRAAAKALTKNGVEGLAIAAPNNEEGTFQFLPWLLSAGGDINKLDSLESEKAFGFITDLINDGSMSSEVINYKQDDISKLFQAGKVAMMVNGPWEINNIKQNVPNLHWAVTKLPKDEKYASVLGGEDLAIIKGKNVDAAWEFLKFVARPDIMRKYMPQFGQLPPRKDVATDKTWSDDPVLSVFMDEMQYAMPRGPHPKWPQISEAISTGLQEAVTKVKTPQQIGKEAQGKIDQINGSK